MTITSETSPTVNKFNSLCAARLTFYMRHGCFRRHRIAAYSRINTYTDNRAFCVLVSLRYAISGKSVILFYHHLCKILAHLRIPYQHRTDKMSAVEITVMHTLFAIILAVSASLLYIKQR